MTAKIHISKLGNSLALPIPDYIVKFLNLKAEDSVICSIENGKLVIEPANKKISKYTLDELLAGEIESSEEVSWGKPEGEEVW
ncbi:AbrB/MazE/SpoVT family DNA-binding domain-containing protein [Microcoleus sp. F6_B4]